MALFSVSTAFAYSKLLLEANLERSLPVKVVNSVANSRQLVGKPIPNLVAFIAFIDSICEDGVFKLLPESTLSPSELKDLAQKKIFRIHSNMRLRQYDPGTSIKRVPFQTAAEACIFTLPRDLLAHISSFVDRAGLLALKATCRAGYMIEPHLIAMNSTMLSQHLSKLLKIGAERPIALFLESCPDTTYSTPLHLTLENDFAELAALLIRISEKFPNTHSFFCRFPLSHTDLAAVLPLLTALKQLACSSPGPLVLPNTLQTLILLGEGEDSTRLLIQVIAMCPQLQKLHFIGKAIDWKNIPPLPTLQELSISVARVNLADLLAWLQNCTHISRLSFDNCQWSDATRDDPHSEKLQFPDSVKQFSIGGRDLVFPLRYVSRHRKLEYLNINSSCLSDQDYEALRLPESLHQFVIRAEVDDGDTELPTPLLLSKLFHCKNLQSIHFEGCWRTLEEAGFDTTQIFRSVIELNLMDSDTTLVLNLQLFPQLKRLMVCLERGIFATREDMPQLFVPPLLKELELEIWFDNSFFKIPKILSQMKDIKSLKVHFIMEEMFSHIDMAVFRKLAQSHPHLQWQLEVRRNSRINPLLFTMNSSLPGVLLPVTWDDSQGNAPVLLQ